MEKEDKDEEIETQLQGVKIMVELSRKRMEMAQKRNVMSVERTYESYERTLSVWIRTALAAMVFGIAIDRLGAAFHVLIPVTIIGAILVIYSILVALFSGIRFIRLAGKYQKEGYAFLTKRRIWVPATYAFMVIFFGTVLLALMIWID